MNVVMRYWTVVIHLVVTERTTTRRFSHSSECLEWNLDSRHLFFWSALGARKRGSHEGETQILSCTLFDTGEGA